LRDAKDIEQVLADPRAAKLFEYAAISLDGQWQYASADTFRECQGMARMLNLLARLPEAVGAQAMKEIEAQDAAKKQALIPEMREDGLAAVLQGLKHFEREGN